MKNRMRTMRTLPNKTLIDKIKCPHCSRGVELTEEKSVSLICKGERRHCFDLSSAGHVNLLRGGHSGSGDSKAAVRARREFLQGGYYRPAADELVRVLWEYLCRGAFVVDAGCGEGYYSTVIAESGFDLLGADISKFAAEAAAKKASAAGLDNAIFTVGSVFELPVFDGTADAVVNIFAPCAEGEFCRVLKTGGILAVVYAGPEHLLGLKRALYDTVKENDGRADMPKSMKLIEERRVSFEITVNGKDDIQNLFSMTPYYWRTSPTDSEKLKDLESLTTAVDMVIAIYRKE